MRKAAIVGAVVVLAAGGIAALFLIKVDTIDRGHPPSYYAKRGVRTIVVAAELFQAAMGRYPASLEDLSSPESAKAGISIEPATDPWGRPYLYTLVDGKPRASCLGRDGVPGGTGEDADVEFPEAVR